MSAHFLAEMPLSSDLAQQISTFLRLKDLHVHFESTKKAISGFKDVECGKTFESQLKEYISALTANIVSTIPDQPTEHHLKHLLKGCKISNSNIDRRCFHAINRFLLTPDLHERKTRVQSFIKKSIFRRFDSLLLSSHLHTKLSTIKCMRSILCCCSKLLDPPAFQRILEIIKHEEIMLSQFASQIKPKYPRLTLNSLRLICCLFQKDNEFILKPSFCCPAEGLLRIEKLYTKHTLSHEILETMALVIYYLCDYICTLDKLDAPYLSQYLNALRFMIYCENDAHVIYRAIKSYFTMFRIVQKKPKDDFSLNISDILGNHEFFAQEQIKKTYQDEYTNKRIIFKKTMKKYQKDEIEFDIPIVVHHLISKYYTACHPVDKMEFILLQRFIDLLSETYDDKIRYLSLKCILFLMLHYRIAVLSKTVQYGLMDKLQLLLTRSHNQSLISLAMIIIRRIISEDLKAVHHAKIIDALLAMAENGADNPADAFMAIDTLARGMRYADPRYIRSVYNEDVMSSVFVSLLTLCKHETPPTQIWDNVIFGTTRVLRMEYMDLNRLTAYDTIKQYQILESKVENQEYLSDWFRFLNLYIE
eukprot:205106_1